MGDIWLNYLTVGAGGTGGTLSWHLARSGQDVTVIARGAHGQAIRENGLIRHALWDNSRISVPVAVETTDTYDPVNSPDVILVCVKSYSLEALVPFLRRVAGQDTVVLPILNVYGTGEKLQEKLPKTTVLDGCIYVSADIESPGVIRQHAPILRVVAGQRDHNVSPRLLEIQRAMAGPDLEMVLSRSIQRDALMKFSYVSPVGAAGVALGATAGDMQQVGPARDLAIALMREVTALASAMGFPFEEDMVKRNLEIMATLPPETTTSMQRDILASRPSEADGLILEPIRLGEIYGVATPAYRQAAAALKTMEEKS